MFDKSKSFIHMAELILLLYSNCSKCPLFAHTHAKTPTRSLVSCIVKCQLRSGPFNVKSAANAAITFYALTASLPSLIDKTIKLVHSKFARGFFL